MIPIRSRGGRLAPLILTAAHQCIGRLVILHSDTGFAGVCVAVAPGDEDGFQIEVIHPGVGQLVVGEKIWKPRDELAFQRMTHRLKTDPDQWDAVNLCDKRAEFRLDDRPYAVGDELRLYRTTSEIPEGMPFIEALIRHIVRGPAFGIPEGYAMLSIDRRYSE